VSCRTRDLLFKILWVYNRATAIYPMKLYIDTEIYFKELKVPLTIMHHKCTVCSK